MVLRTVYRVHLQDHHVICLLLTRRRPYGVYQKVDRLPKIGFRKVEDCVLEHLRLFTGSENVGKCTVEIAVYRVVVEFEGARNGSDKLGHQRTVYRVGLCDL